MHVMFPGTTEEVPSNALTVCVGLINNLSQYRNSKWGGPKVFPPHFEFPF